jgi:hypothetical protein
MIWRPTWPAGTADLPPLCQQTSLLETSAVNWSNLFQLTADAFDDAVWGMVPGLS